MIKHLRTLTLLLVCFCTGIFAAGEPMVLKFNTNLGPGTEVSLPLDGTVNVTVDWGDGNSDNYNTSGVKTHTYASQGTYTVSISGLLNRYGNGRTYTNAEKLIQIVSFGDLNLAGLYGSFMNTTNLSSLPTTLPASVSSLNKTFNGASQTTITGVESWDVSNVTNMQFLFKDASSFNQDISNWNVANVTSMTGAFSGASAFNQNISSWNVANVKYFNYMFERASSFNQNIGGWSVDNAVSMRQMFIDARSFDQNISSWNVSKVTDMYRMFDNAEKFNQNINSWNVNLVTSMHKMFNGASAFNQNLNSWQVGAVTDMQGMFQNCPLFNGNIGSWNVSSVTDMSSMFSGASAFNQDIGNWNVGNVTNMSNMFNGATAFNANLSSWSGDNLDNAYRMFMDASSFNGDLEKLVTAKVTTTEWMFSGATSFNKPIGGWNVSGVTKMLAMFSGATSFNQDIGSWDVSKVTTMRSMFNNAKSFNQDITNWDVGRVTTMRYMFASTDAFNQDISNWNVSNVTNMYCMFGGAVSFDQNIGGWNVTKVTDMERMFEDAALSTANYDALLSGWSQQAVSSGVTFDGGNSKYSNSAAAARLSLINNKNWTITDGGEASGVITQTINLSTGWNLISFNVKPSNLSPVSVFSGVSTLKIVKNNAAQTYVPAYGQDDIKSINVGEGYAVYVTAPATLEVSGEEVSSSITLNSKWNILPYFPRESTSIETALSGIASKIKLVTDNNAKSYVPAYNQNDIGQMTPGEGYWIYMNESATLTYPGM